MKMQNLSATSRMSARMALPATDLSRSCGTDSPEAPGSGGGRDSRFPGPPVRERLGHAERPGFQNR